MLPGKNAPIALDFVTYAGPGLEMQYSFGRYLLPHLPPDRDNSKVKLDDEVDFQYYRLQRVFPGAINLADGLGEYNVKRSANAGTGKAKDEKAIEGAVLSKVILRAFLKLRVDRIGKTTPVPYGNAE